MLQTDEDLKAYCYRHAEECARRATSQSDARHRQVYLELEKRWLSLSSEFACTEQVEGRDDDHSDQKRENYATKPLPDSAAPSDPLNY